MSSSEKQARFPALAFRRPVIISGTVKPKAFFQENLPFFVCIRDFGAFVWLVISAVAVKASTITRNVCGLIGC